MARALEREGLAPAFQIVDVQVKCLVEAPIQVGFGYCQAVHQEVVEGHCQVVISGLRKALLVELGDHLCGIAWPPIESVGSGVTV